ncbi:MAG: glycosyltransferase family 39 protein [Chloroflexota bacterium]
MTIQTAPVTRKYSRPLWLLVVLSFSLAVKFAILFQSDSSQWAANDTTSYINSARALLQTGTFSISPENPEPQTIRTPGYPIFLAFIYGLVGENQMAVLAAQILFSLGTIAITYWIGTKLWNSKIGFASALLLALDMNSIGFSLLLLTETLFTFFLCAFLAVVVFLLDLGAPLAENRKRHLNAAFLAGLFLSVATHIRPITYYLIPLVLVAWLILGFIKKWDRLAWIASWLAFFVPILVLICGWQVRNSLQTASPQFSAIESVNMINYRAAMVIAERDGISRDEAIHQITEECNLNQNPGWNETWRRVGIGILLENPQIFIKQYARSLADIFIGPGSETLANLVGMEIKTSSPLGDLVRLLPGNYAERWIYPHPVYFSVFVISMLHMLLIYFGTILWLAQLLFKRSIVIWPAVFLFGVAVYLALVSAGPEAYYRFRVPMTPMLVLLAASAMAGLFAKKQPVSQNSMSRSPT